MNTPTPRLELLDDFTATLESTGLAPMSARVLSAILLSDEGSLTSRDIIDRLGVSPAAVSHAVRQLEMLHFIRRRRPAGQRREHYDLVGSLWAETTMNQCRVFEHLARTLGQGADASPDGSAVKLRLERSSTFFQHLADGIPELIETMPEA